MCCKWQMIWNFCTATCSSTIWGPKHVSYMVLVFLELIWYSGMHDSTELVWYQYTYIGAPNLTSSWHRCKLFPYYCCNNICSRQHATALCWWTLAFPVLLMLLKCYIAAAARLGTSLLPKTCTNANSEFLSLQSWVTVSSGCWCWAVNIDMHVLILVSGTPMYVLIGGLEGLQVQLVRASMLCS